MTMVLDGSVLCLPTFISGLLISAAMADLQGWNERANGFMEGSLFDVLWQLRYGLVSENLRSQG